jgi:hypothetical protein
MTPPMSGLVARPPPAESASAALAAPETASASFAAGSGGTGAGSGSEETAPKRPATQREYTSAPIVKLSVGLIKTYKHINEVSAARFGRGVEGGVLQRYACL